MTDASNIKFDNIHFIIKNQLPVFSITGSKDICINKVKYKNGLPSLLQVNGAVNELINVQNTDLKSIGKVLELKNGASENSVTFK